MTRREPASSEITPEAHYLKRRELMRQGALFLGASTAFGGGLLWVTGAGKGGPPPEAAPSPAPVPSGVASARVARFRSDEPPTSYQDITHYNNFYEFGLTKFDPAANAHTLKPRPWTIEVSGLVEKPLVLDIESLLKWFPLEERIYRMRCVEAWSMVIPWLGFPLGALIEKLKPTSSARYVAFQTLLDEEQMPLTKEPTLAWPYVEGLRLDEAMHPLTLLAVGLYGKLLPNQNGAPMRLVVPWKYGFKGIKSIVKIRFTDTEPVTTWSRTAPKSYGFYANVNPHVSHPRWSQETERRIGDLERRPTLLFNGYADEVASLYRGMDLAKYY